MTAPYLGPNTRRSVLQLAGTGGAFALSWLAAFLSLQVSYLLTLVFVVPAAAFLVRLFMIQHDCGHGSYFRSRLARDVVGFCIGILALTPYHYWRRTHAHHHAHSGDLSLRGFGDVTTLTVREYLALPAIQRLGYRIYRNPVAMLGFGPVFHFILKHRYPWDTPREWKSAWASVWWTNACLAGILVLATFTIGLVPFLLVTLPVSILAGAAGILLFYVQHQFEDTYWRPHPEWDFFDAAILGSSHLVLPRPLQWLTASIGIHHLHHLSSRIPNYRLQECLDANPALQRATRITLRDCVRLFKYALWDEDAERLISFRELDARGDRPQIDPAPRVDPAAQSAGGA
ncbi:MAG TPA: fatty acid desaturase [Longimicrobiales bacterium]|nr:fatty acid desaturase [Longimicrobiales bacterium]